MSKHYKELVQWLMKELKRGVRVRPAAPGGYTRKVSVYDETAEVSHIVFDEIATGVKVCPECGGALADAVLCDSDQDEVIELGFKYCTNSPCCWAEDMDRCDITGEGQA